MYHPRLSDFNTGRSLAAVTAQLRVQSIRYHRPGSLRRCLRRGVAPSPCHQNVDHLRQGDGRDHLREICSQLIWPGGPSAPAQPADLDRQQQRHHQRAGPRSISAPSRSHPGNASPRARVEAPTLGFLEPDHRALGTTTASTNKSVARNNKSRTGGSATNRQGDSAAPMVPSRRPPSRQDPILRGSSAAASFMWIAR